MTIEFWWDGKRYECQRPDGPPPLHTRLLAKHSLGPSMWLDLEYVTRDEKRSLERYRVAKVTKQGREVECAKS